MSDSIYAYMTTKDNSKIRVGFWPASDNRHNSMKQNVILLTGRASFMERYDDVIQRLVSQHFNVWSLDWRGQGLSSRVLNDASKSHIDSYETYLQDLDQFITEIVQPKSDEIYMGMAQSMGAHIILRYLEDYKNNFSGVMLVSPMLDILTGRYPRIFVELLATFCANFGWADRLVMGSRQHDAIVESFENNYYTRNALRYQQLLDLQKNYINALVGRPTYGWLYATLASVKLLLNPERLQKIDIPVCVIESGDDRVVDNRLIPHVMKFLKQGFHKTYSQARHQIFSENDDVIQEFWHDFDAFADYIDTTTKASLYKNQIQKMPILSQEPNVKMMSNGVRSLN